MARRYASAERYENRTWICEQCTTSNKNHILKCINCQNYKSSRDIRVINWECDICKTNNKKSEFYCSKNFCRGKAPFYGFWPCDDCTLLNQQFALKCNVCDKNNTHLKQCNVCGSTMVNDLYGKKCPECYKTNKKKNSELRNRNNERNPNINKYNDQNNNIDRHNRNRNQINNNKNNQNEFSCKQCGCNTKNKFRYCNDCCWKCNSRFCNTLTGPNLQYCYSCGLQKGGICKPGILVLVKVKDEILTKWQCPKCGHFENPKVKCTRC